MPVFTIIATDPAQVRAGVPEAEIGRIRIGQTAEIRVPALPNHRFFGPRPASAVTQRQHLLAEPAISSPAAPRETGRTPITQSNRSKGNQSWPS